MPSPKKIAKCQIPHLVSLRILLIDCMEDLSLKWQKAFLSDEDALPRSRMAPNIRNDLISQIVVELDLGKHVQQFHAENLRRPLQACEEVLSKFGTRCLRHQAMEELKLRLDIGNICLSLVQVWMQQPDKESREPICPKKHDMLK